MNKDIGIIRLILEYLILEYIESILRTQKRFGNDLSVFKSPFLCAIWRKK